MRMSKKVLSILALFLFFATNSLAAVNEDWRSLSPREKERIRRNYQRWENLPSQDKEHLREEWKRWQSLPKDRRERLKQRYDEQRGDRDRNRD